MLVLVFGALLCTSQPAAAQFTQPGVKLVGAGSVRSAPGRTSHNDAGAINSVWANDGEDKVTQDELRAYNGTSVTNTLWDGNTISLFGAKNEIVNFNLILEAPTASATNVSVSISNLTGPGGSIIRYSPRSTGSLFNWTTTEIEVFYVSYLQILGLSGFGGTLASFQEPTFPARAQCPSAEGAGCPWTDRPVANKFYPDIAVPIELVPTFNIAVGNNQSIWVDVYIPKTVTAGIYTGALTISENGVTTHIVPVELQVRNFSLPDSPNSKTMLFTTVGDLAPRYGDASAFQAMNNEIVVAHRHKISIIDGDNMGTGWSGDAPAAQWIPFLNGSAFTAASGYAGPGVGAGNGVFSIGTYGSMTNGTTQSAFTANFNNWESWFEANSSLTERFVYLCDEVACKNNTPDLPTQLGWWSAIAGPGQNLHTMATQLLLDAVSTTLSDPTSGWPYSQAPTGGMGGTSAADQAAVNSVKAQESTRRLFAYNGGRPGSGSFATDDVGVALRELPWGQYKKGIDRWFFWEATYYYNYQWTGAKTNVFTTAQTFGPAPQDPLAASYGMANYYSNGDGVLFYPGTDLLYPSNSYGINGPIASLRLKYWRRGIQDVDYLVLASQANPTAVQNLVSQMVPEALWENQCFDPVNDCSYFKGPISWSENPDNWESARLQLADIIDPPKTPTFTASPTAGPAPLAVTFTASGLALPMTYTINFGDGTTGALTQGSCIGINAILGGQGGIQCSGSASHNYTGPGSYSATLLNSLGLMVGTAAISVTGAAPKISFTATSPSTPGAGIEYNRIDASGGIAPPDKAANASVPTISSFTASPALVSPFDAGASATLSWSVASATSLSISGLGAVLGNSIQVSPSQTTTYTLTASNAQGAVTAQTTVTVAGYRSRRADPLSR
jgi:hypothetical protein